MKTQKNPWTSVKQKYTFNGNLVILPCFKIWKDLLVSNQYDND